MRGAAGLLAAIAALALPGAAGAVLVPQQGMRGLRVGMNVSQVRAAAGAPSATSFQRNEIIGRVRVYRYGLTRVQFDGTARDARVIALTTTSRRERTSAGVGVGSTRAVVDRRVRGSRCVVEFGVDHCYVGAFTPGRIVTDFLIGRGGRVTRISVGRVID